MSELGKMYKIDILQESVHVPEEKGNKSVEPQFSTRRQVSDQHPGRRKAKGPSLTLKVEEKGSPGQQESVEQSTREDRKRDRVIIIITTDRS